MHIGLTLKAISTYSWELFGRLEIIGVCLASGCLQRTSGMLTSSGIHSNEGQITLSRYPVNLSQNVVSIETYSFVGTFELNVSLNAHEYSMNYRTYSRKQ